MYQKQTIIIAYCIIFFSAGLNLNASANNPYGINLLGARTSPFPEIVAPTNNEPSISAAQIEILKIYRQLRKSQTLDQELTETLNKLFELIKILPQCKPCFESMEKQTNALPAAVTIINSKELKSFRNARNVPKLTVLKRKPGQCKHDARRRFNTREKK